MNHRRPLPTRYGIKLSAERHNPRAPVLLCVAAISALGAAAPPTPSNIKQPPKPTDQRKVFAPGVRIDWQQRLVEVDATVVLREGPLELLACSPHTREHESILSVRARPMHVFQAMGLIGLQPGLPAHHDKKQDRYVAPVGESLELRVCYGEGSARRCVFVERWLVDIEHRRPPGKINWVFAGSRTFEGGRFGADVDGTVVCVVDFDTALIAVGALHSADNELLWLTVNTEAIPPVGTPCTLLIRSAGSRTIVVDLGVDGVLRCEGKPILDADFVRTAQREGREITDITVLLRAGSIVSAERVQSTVDSLVRTGINRASIRVEREIREPQKAAPAEKKDDG